MKTKQCKLDHDQGQLLSKNKKRRKFNKDQWQLLSLTIPGSILLILFHYLPLSGIILAFKKYSARKGIFGSPWVGLKNFEFFFKSGVVGRLLRNTILMNLLFIIVGTVLSVIAALLLYEITHRMSIKVIQTVVFLPYVISWVAASYATRALFDMNGGLMNQLLEYFGRDPIMWYTEPQHWPLILLICNLWKGIGYSMLFKYSTLLSIDSSYFEAAQLDGANRLQQMWYISLPHLLPITSMFLILDIGGIFGSDFGLFYFMPANSTMLYKTTDVIGTYVYRALQELGDVGMSTAIGLAQSVAGFILLVITNKLAARKGNDLGRLF